MMRHHTALSFQKSSQLTILEDMIVILILIQILVLLRFLPDPGIAAFLGFYEKSKLFLLALTMSSVFISDVIALLQSDT